MTVASAVGFLALLEEPNHGVQSNALRALEDMVNYNWHEMANSLDILKDMARAEQFPERQLAALITSKIFFHLGDFGQSVSFALMAGDHFQLSSGDDHEYVDVILAKAIDRYVQARQSFYPNKGRFSDPELCLLEALIERLVTRCTALQEYVHIIGIGIDCRRLDLLAKALDAAQNPDQRLGLIYYIVDLSVRLPNDFQRDLLTLCMSHLKQTKASPDYVTIADCLVTLNDSRGLIDLLHELISDAKIEIALQICFNVNDNGSATLKEVVMNELKGVQVLHDTVSGDTGNLLRLHFLSKSVASDLLILERTRTLFNPGNSMFHSAVSLANGLMHSGTTNDEFIRKNMEWLSAASNWSKYTAVSTLGSVYRGHRQESRSLLSQYLPKPGVVSSEYSEAGSLFALGLIHCGHVQDKWVIDYLLDVLKSSDSEVIKHGCCFGIGAAGFACLQENVMESVKTALFSDNAVSGEGAAIAIGLIMFGSGDLELCNELLSYARDTKHNKIIRSLCVAVGLIMYGQQSSATHALCNQLLNDQDGWMRFCACWILALSHAGTGSRSALGLLLRTAVTDSNQDVRRVAVIGMAFVLIGRSAELPEMVRLLLESYNPNLRFGALLALGIGFAGTGDLQALDMVDKLMRTDKTDYVRQAAMLAAAMILCVQSEKAQGPLRQHLERVIGTKHEEALSKFGAVLAQGIMDAGGRNQTIALVLPNGLLDPLAVAGMALFCQFWFWHPNVSFLSLALRPIALIAVTGSLQAPLLNATCSAKPSLYAYPAPLKGDKEIAPVKLVTAVLSTSAAAGTVSHHSKDPKQQQDRPTDEPQTEAAVEKPERTDKDVPMEADSFSVPNFSRVTPSQAKTIQFEGRYLPVSRFHSRIITVVTDDQHDQVDEFIDLNAIDSSSRQ